MRKLKRRLRRWAWCLGTAGAAAALSYATLGMVAIPMVVAVVFHEAAHYLFATFANARTQPPIFVPLGVGIVGLTKVVDAPAQFMPLIAAAGPLAGVAVGAGVVVGGVLASSALIAGIGAIVICTESAAVIVGKDGRIFRKYRRKDTVWTSC